MKRDIPYRDAVQLPNFGAHTSALVGNIPIFVMFEPAIPRNQSMSSRNPFLPILRDLFDHSNGGGEVPEVF